MATLNVNIMKCPNCDNQFSSREAKCEDWRDPKKSLICPHCDTYLEHDPAGAIYFIHMLAWILFNLYAPGFVEPYLGGMGIYGAIFICIAITLLVLWWTGALGKKAPGLRVIK